jgi:uncharacterized membrane protein
MLISPLMSPILGVGLSVAIHEKQLLTRRETPSLIIDFVFLKSEFTLRFNISLMYFLMQI